MLRDLLRIGFVVVSFMGLGSGFLLGFKLNSTVLLVG